MHNQEKFPFRRFHKVCGVYVAIHRESGMTYVGSSVNIRNRLRSHIWDAARGSKRCFHSALREFGVTAFDFECVKECSPHELLEWERIHIALLGAATLDGFNTLRNPSKTRAGTACSDVTKRRISEAQKGRQFTDEQRRKMSESHRGVPLTEETRAKMSAARKGRKISPEHIEILRRSNTNRVVSKETREKMRQLATGRKCSEEAKRKISASIKLIRAVKKW